MAAFEVPPELIAIGLSLIADRKDNTHCTRDPIYTVQKERRVYWIEDGEEEGAVWIEDGEECDSALSARLERRHRRGWELPERYQRCGFKITWEFVDVFLSIDAAKAAVESLNRRHGSAHRLYVESGYRNQEWQMLQRLLISIAEQQDKTS
jgi:hypothetical protein